MTATATKSTGRSKARSSASTTKSENLGAEIAALREEVAAVTDRLSKVAGAGVREAKQRGDESAMALQKTSDQLIDDLTRQLNEIEVKAGTAVRQHPIQALGIAAGIGFLAAILMRR
ncbi:MAG: DUF883 family protein [Roseitalea sp.]|jgi:ElaB/YqjD/DUF883 family membrane-anchored ribosome-binding protein|uniref:DUF883 family protein n=1 Tax=Oceaniradius stylonematis TaxID=2184161 RepID=A0A3A8AC60_9HYPH|nr:DUF883 family protein [Oceaniradius stylonematis]MBO6554257.1 DUF883 family protein [Roseitalea sp.]MBO6953301.1 DUF883 family protein [Rhizobiaceae bacterium]RNC91259.1 MAG: DUF883 family protein [Oricola sp.]MBO6593648.1 DUF883 family protein [Roseitalea sp.]MBO6601044.1 DUF883 family protein [Roseitalea sp.]